MHYRLLLKTLALGLVTFLGLALFILSNQIGGFRAFVVLSGSMEPTLKVGSLVVAQKIDPRLLEPFDIVTFVRPDNPKEFVTHRIIGKTTRDGVAVFQTFGDNNANIDNWKVVGGAVIGKVVSHIPYAGYLLSLTQGKLAIVFLIILPALFIVTEELRTLMQLLKGRKINTSVAPALMLVFVSVTAISGLRSTYALLSDTSRLAGNSYSLALLSPTATPTPIPTSTPVITPTPTDTCEPDDKHESHNDKDYQDEKEDKHKTKYDTEEEKERKNKQPKCHKSNKEEHEDKERRDD